MTRANWWDYARVECCPMRSPMWWRPDRVPLVTWVSAQPGDELGWLPREATPGPWSWLQPAVKEAA